MKKSITALCQYYFLLVSLFLLMVQPALSQQKLIGEFEGHSDVGPVLHKGSATYNPTTKQYTLTGSGTNIWGEQDEFHFIWKRMKGDFILYTRGQLQGKGVDSHRKIGWMVRKSLEATSPHVIATVHGDGLTAMQFRKTAGGATEETRSAVTNPDVIQLERRGNKFTMSVARFGEPFVNTQTSDIALGDDVYVGLFISAHNKDVTEKATFKDVRLTVPARENFVAYREYIGSNIELLDVNTGKRDIIFTSPKSLQAPNWTPDGKTLIYNSEGLMYTLDIAKRQPKVLNTGSVKNNNNDHVLSFDGKMLGLSSGVSELGGSIIYTVPVTGGEPKQITPRGPSYLHGWSPDGKTLTFTAQREQEFDIYTVPTAGGPEKRLTNAKGLDDGSEYTPDGKYIYFNSSRSGTMQIWRMKADGSEQEAVTSGEFYDWFPHISPDGKWIVFFSFLKEEVKVDDHPFYRHVYLRMMPISGGQPKVIAYVYGGQGSINTPSWSPDSKRVAFVSNTDVNAK